MTNNRASMSLYKFEIKQRMLRLSIYMINYLLVKAQNNFKDVFDSFKKLKALLVEQAQK